MKARTKQILLNLLAFAFLILHVDAGFKTLQDVTLLIIRHAEKPDAGPDLSPEGNQRARAYVKYFEDFKVDSSPMRLDCLFAAADSKNSSRPRLTLTPLGHALQRPLDLRYKDKNVQGLAADLRSNARGKNILICWHHGEIPDLIHALGADPDALLPGGKWPADQFGWVIELRYDHEGRLLPGECQRIEERLMPTDALRKAGQE